MDETLRNDARELVLETLSLAPSSFAALYGTACRMLAARLDVGEMCSLVEELARSGQLELVTAHGGGFVRAPLTELQRRGEAYRQWLGKLAPDQLTVDELSIDPVGMWLRVLPAGRATSDVDPRLTPLESAVIHAILAAEDPSLLALRAQLDGIVVTQREYCGAGFFTELAVRASAVPAPVAKMRLGSELDVQVRGVPDGAGFVLCVDGGVMTMLEGFTYGDAWPVDAQLGSIRPEPRRRALPRST